MYAAIPFLLTNLMSKMSQSLRPLSSKEYWLSLLILSAHSACVLRSVTICKSSVEYVVFVHSGALVGFPSQCLNVGFVHSYCPKLSVDLVGDVGVDCGGTVSDLVGGCSIFVVSGPSLAVENDRRGRFGGLGLSYS